MAHAPFQPTKLFARDIARYNDTELDRYLEVNGRCVDVDDPENLPDHFIQRLRARTGVGDLPQPRSIDLNYVSARLNKVVSDKTTPPRSPSPAPSTISMDDEEYDRYSRGIEIEDYNKLISDGGRPSHPITLECNIAKNLPEYRDIILYWQSGAEHSDSWMGFSSQWWRWQAFREHQRLHRGGDFPTYCQIQYDRLKHHGFQHLFRLDKQPDRQNKLTTWLEYLSYQYWMHDRKANIVTRHQSRYDEAWKKLLDSKILKPLETAESFDYFFFLQLKHEKTDAENALESATFYMNSANKELADAQMAGSSSLSAIAHKVATATSKMVTARELLEQSSCRYELIGDFMDVTKPYRIAKEKVDHMRLLLSWISDQIPIIELESNPPKRKLKRNLPTDYSNQPVLKRQKREVELSPEKSIQQPTSPDPPTNSKPLNPKSGVVEACVMPSDERVKKRRWYSKLSLDGSLKVLRRSSRLKRTPERFR